ncbi:ABC transporter substrate-binding protein [Natronobeatus ordinarius]|uniref:ABC transporter substrate-binding protein n=1 Tax=Natronobeatus ordinarius TaxID=2963433 RepID=UPI0020CCC4A6|nr:ABC transporter substrate-binding protein [Natronobeatus ordinarius]
MGLRHGDEPQSRGSIGRRRFLAATGLTVSSAALAGCFGGNDADLTIFSGRTEDQIEPIFREVEDRLEITIADRYGSSEGMVGEIVEAGEGSGADLFYTQDSGTLGALKAEGRTADLSDAAVDAVPEAYRDPDGTWVGVSGRTRAIAYNTDRWAAEELPNDIFAYAEDDRFDGELGWRVDSGSFLSFMRAMMIEYGEDATREWVEGLQALGITNNEGGMTTPQQIANGELSVGFVNHYYVGRLLEDDPDAPINVTFTNGDVGALFNVSGVALVDTADDVDLAREVVEEFLAEGVQELFVELNAEYPVVDGVEYTGDMPGPDELNPPTFDLNDLADVDPASDLLRETGVL